MRIHEDSEEFKNIQSMFPTWSAESLYTLYEANDFSVEVTVQSILTIEGSNEVSAPSSDEPAPASIPTSTPTANQTELPRLIT